MSALFDLNPTASVPEINNPLKAPASNLTDRVDATFDDLTSAGHWYNVDMELNRKYKKVIDDIYSTTGEKLNNPYEDNQWSTDDMNRYGGVNSSRRTGRTLELIEKARMAREINPDIGDPEIMRAAAEEESRRARQRSGSLEDTGHGVGNFVAGAAIGLVVDPLQTATLAVPITRLPLAFAQNSIKNVLLNVGKEALLQGTVNAAVSGGDVYLEHLNELYQAKGESFLGTELPAKNDPEYIKSILMGGAAGMLLGGIFRGVHLAVGSKTAKDIFTPEQRAAGMIIESNELYGPPAPGISISAYQAGLEKTVEDIAKGRVVKLPEAVVHEPSPLAVLAEDIKAEGTPVVPEFKRYPSLEEALNNMSFTERQKEIILKNPEKAVADAIKSAQRAVENKMSEEKIAFLANRAMMISEHVAEGVSIRRAAIVEAPVAEPTGGVLEAPLESPAEFVVPPGHTVYYHGTREAEANTILKEGLDPRKTSDVEEPYVFMSENVGTAEDFAPGGEYHTDPGKGVILRITIPEEMNAKMVTDKGEYLRFPELIPPEYITVFKYTNDPKSAKVMDGVRQGAGIPGTAAEAGTTLPATPETAPGGPPLAPDTVSLPRPVVLEEVSIQRIFTPTSGETDLGTGAFFINKEGKILDATKDGHEAYLNVSGVSEVGLVRVTTAIEPDMIEIGVSSASSRTSAQDATLRRIDAETKKLARGGMKANFRDGGIGDAPPKEISVNEVFTITNGEADTFGQGAFFINKEGKILDVSYTGHDEYLTNTGSKEEGLIRVTTAIDNTPNTGGIEIGISSVNDRTPAQIATLKKIQAQSNKLSRTGAKSNIVDEGINGVPISPPSPDTEKVAAQKSRVAIMPDKTVEKLVLEAEPAFKIELIEAQKAVKAAEKEVDLATVEHGKLLESRVDIPPSAPEGPKLKRFLKENAPRFRQANRLKFESDVDRAAYLLSVGAVEGQTRKGVSREFDELIDFLHANGISEEQAIAHGKSIKDGLSNVRVAKTATIDVPDKGLLAKPKSEPAKKLGARDIANEAELDKMDALEYTVETQKPGTPEYKAAKKELDQLKASLLKKARESAPPKVEDVPIDRSALDAAEKAHSDAQAKVDELRATLKDKTKEMKKALAENKPIEGPPEVLPEEIVAKADVELAKEEAADALLSTPQIVNDDLPRPPEPVKSPTEGEQKVLDDAMWKAVKEKADADAPTTKMVVDEDSVSKRIEEAEIAEKDALTITSCTETSVM